MEKPFQKLREVFPDIIDDNFIYEYLDKSYLIHLKNNEILVPANTRNRSAYFIVQGSFLRNIITPEGNEVTIMFHTDKFYNYMACMDSFFLNEVSQYSITANESAIVIRTEADIIEYLKQANPAFITFYTSYLEKTFVFTETIRNNLLAMNSEDYLHWLYKNHPFIFSRFQSQNIASFMGITPVWFSKLKKRVIS